MISVIIPTIDSRREYLRQCLAAYDKTTREREFIVIENESCCGDAWCKGAERATGDYLHFSADDLIPHTGWWQAGVEVIERGNVPAPAVYKESATAGKIGALESVGGYWVGYPEDGTVVKNTCVVPFCSASQWDQIGPPLAGAHYYTDNWYSLRARCAGCHIEVCYAYAFTHRWAPQGRYGQNRMVADRERYRIAVEAIPDWQRARAASLG
jgi:GT2 family glycosyltransferase